MRASQYLDRYLDRSGTPPPRIVLEQDMPGWSRPEGYVFIDDLPTGLIARVDDSSGRDNQNGIAGAER